MYTIISLYDVEISIGGKLFFMKIYSNYAHVIIGMCKRETGSQCSISKNKNKARNVLTHCEICQAVNFVGIYFEKLAIKI